MDLNQLKKVRYGFKALHQLGFSQVGLYGLYRFGLLMGHYRRLTPSKPLKLMKEGVNGIDPGIIKAFRGALAVFPIESLYALYPLSASEPAQLEQIAHEICQGQFHPYGGPAVPLRWDAIPASAHWTAYERNQIRLPAGLDIKDVWEPARFGWAFPLGRAYSLNHLESYALFFWDALETFMQANPPYQGVQWMSGQEVALRLIALIDAGHAFLNSTHTTESRVSFLYQALIDHASRIPPTLVYARSQNNNHLLSEATGLYTAGWLLGETAVLAAQDGFQFDEKWSRRFQQWKETGWHWLNQGLQTQIDAEGTYAQYSSNYHRLMLQLALWTEALSQANDAFTFPEETRQHLAAASHWLTVRIDPLTGQVPNLGANDGAYMMPLTPAPYSDYRPVANAARLFEKAEKPSPERSNDGLLTHPLSQARAYLRTAYFSSRPSHADILHVDIWWQGINLARDAGTYRYNAPAPWSNSLDSAAVHNTLMVDNHEPMTRVSRFLWLDWSQSRIKESKKDSNGNFISFTAEQDGYYQYGVVHRRRVSFDPEGNLYVEDELLSSHSSKPNEVHAIRLHWLLPDWNWQIEGRTLFLSSHEKSISLAIAGAEKVWLARAGTILYGEGPVTATTGWYSPTYAQKEPALAWLASTVGPLPIKLESKWNFSAKNSGQNLEYMSLFHLLSP